MLFLQNTSFRSEWFSRLVIFSLCLLMMWATPDPVRAGGGPENVFLVVNPQSADSMTIANYYQIVRQIPAGNIFYLPWDAKKEGVSVYYFRKDILTPILEAIRSRRLAGQIDYIIYSCDYPWQIFLDDDLARFKIRPTEFAAIEFPKEMSAGQFVASAPTAKQWKLAPRKKIAPGVTNECTPYASLNGLTYFYASVMEASPNYMDWQGNRYMRIPVDEQKDAPTIGFRNSLKFGPLGQTGVKLGPSYMLSAVLGSTAAYGNSVEEIKNYLERSSSVDGKLAEAAEPEGIVYFAKNSDVRSVVRDGWFPDTVEELKKLGVEAKIVSGTVPLNRDNVQGVCTGTEVFKWENSGSKILPGAICENYTSFGGVMSGPSGQTPLTEFLRYGAAGSSGTVGEPFALWQKFPLPTVQLHYARGCSLAEAFYQSVYGPYQLMIVGDPLCKPWARIPKVEVAGAKNGDIVKGELVITPKATVPKEGEVDHFELFVNGSRAAQCKPGEDLKLDTTLLPDGFQELRIVAVEDGPIQSQGRAYLRVTTDNYERKIQVLSEPHSILKRGDVLKLNVKSPGSMGVAVLQNSRIVGRIGGEEGTVEIPVDNLGSGRVRLQAIGLGKEQPVPRHVLAIPLEIEVDLSKKSTEKNGENSSKK
jgi:hypothetical protein